MGIPQKPKRSLMLQTSATVLVSDKQTGSVMKPFSNLVKGVSTRAKEQGRKRERTS